MAPIVYIYNICTISLMQAADFDWGHGELLPWVFQDFVIQARDAHGNNIKR